MRRRSASSSNRSRRRPESSKPSAASSETSVGELSWDAMASRSASEPLRRGRRLGSTRVLLTIGEKCAIAFAHQAYPCAGHDLGHSGPSSPLAVGGRLLHARATAAKERGACD